MNKKKEVETEIVEAPGQAVQVRDAEIKEDSSSPEWLIAKAIEKDVSIDTMERLLAMRREFRAERAKEQFVRAMSAFQAEVPIIAKTKPVPTKSGKVAYSFAPLESIVQQTKDLLDKHGFSYKTEMELKEQAVRVTCIVTHKDGHSESTSMEVPLGTKTDVMSNTQVVAAAQTFAKRYAFCNAFGIMTADEDSEQMVGQGQNEIVKEELGKDRVSEAIEKLERAENLEQLKGIWLTLGTIIAHPEVARAKDRIKKDKFGGS